jgi:hypothetical protein
MPNRRKATIQRRASDRGVVTPDPTSVPTFTLTYQNVYVSGK